MDTTTTTPAGQVAESAFHAWYLVAGAGCALLVVAVAVVSITLAVRAGRRSRPRA